MKVVTLLLLGVLMAMCSAGATRGGQLVFLTREGCVQTDLMRERLDAALVKAAWPPTYQVVDLASLGPDDARRGYPTPTLLWNGRDVYGMPAPIPPFPEPT